MITRKVQASYCPSYYGLLPQIPRSHPQRGATISNLKSLLARGHCNEAGFFPALHSLPSTKQTLDSIARSYLVYPAHEDESQLDLKTFFENALDLSDLYYYAGLKKALGLVCNICEPEFVRKRIHTAHHCDSEGHLACQIRSLGMLRREG